MCVLSENLPAAGNYNETLTCGRGNGFFDKLREPLGSFFVWPGFYPAWVRLRKRLKIQNYQTNFYFVDIFMDI